jgi:hypothetical protein
MRVPSFLAASALVAASLVGAPARADNNFDVAIAHGQITVTAHTGWHVNKDFPWTVKKKDGDKLVTVKDKADFTLAETTASVAGVPKGPFTLKGAVCKDGACQPFAKEISVN